MTIYDHWLYRFLTGPLNNVAWLYILLPCVFAGGIYLTVGSGAVQFRRFGYAMKNTAGKLFKKQETAHGAITPLQAVTTALAATVGTGNIVGTSQAIAMGGYGAVFWLWMAALLGMVIKYSEVLLAVKYRERDARGDWVGGPMYYIQNGLGKKWKWLGVLFAIFGIFAVFGTGNATQVNTIVASIDTALISFGVMEAGSTATLNLILGIVITVLVGMILLGGIKRIGHVAERLVPIMALLYVVLGLGVIIVHIGNLPVAFSSIIKGAFNPTAVTGGVVGAMFTAVQKGVARGIFSNEAGLGSAPIAHAAAHCDGPVEQGIYGIFEVFMDTIVICTLTALTIIISGVDVTFGVKPGSALITAAFGTVFNGTFSSVFIAVALTFFAYSTILGWSLYGSRCVQYLLGLRAAKVYQFVFIIMIVVGSVSSLDFVWNIADTLNGLMAIPNFIALFALSPVIFKITREYFRGVDLASAKHE